MAKNTSDDDSWRSFGCLMRLAQVVVAVIAGLVAGHLAGDGLFSAEGLWSDLAFFLGPASVILSMTAWGWVAVASMLWQALVRLIRRRSFDEPPRFGHRWVPLVIAPFLGLGYGWVFAWLNDAPDARLVFSGWGLGVGAAMVVLSFVFKLDMVFEDSAEGQDL